MKPKDHAKQITQNHGLTERSYYSYKHTLTHYSELMQMELDDLLLEAEAEEEQGIRWKHRKLKERLTTYQNWLLKQYKYNTVKSYMTKIKTWYYDHDIEIGKLPPLNKKQARIGEPITYEDLPTKEIIRKAYDMSSPVFRAVILFAISSGCAKTEIMNLTIHDFYEWIRPYSIDEVLDKEVDIVPTIRLRRQKTNKHYTTFCSPEAVREICIYLKTRDDDDEKLFKVSHRTITTYCHNINTKLGLDKVNGTQRFRMHMLRKYHASHLYNAENGLSLDEIDSLQGRSKNTVRESYYFNNTEDLKKKYIRNIGQVTILDQVHTITVDSPEVARLKEKAEKIDELEKLVKRIMEENTKKKEIGDGEK